MNKLRASDIQNGFSLIELMIAMVLGLILIGGVVNVFLASSQTYRLQEAMFRVQESGRFALDIMLRDLRDAGFQDLLDLNNSRDVSITAVQGFQVGAPPANVVAGVTSEILSIPPNAANSGGGVAYYVAPDAGGQSTLFRNANAVVEGVENVAFTYGVDTNSDREPDAYLSVAAVGATQWSDVVTVRASFLVASNDAGVVDQAQVAPAPFNAAPYLVDTSDRRLYKVYSTTVSLRNKMP